MLRSKNFLRIQVGLCILLAGVYADQLAAASIVNRIANRAERSNRVLYAQVAGLQLRGVQNTPEGIVLLINGNPQIQSERAVNPDRLVIDLAGTVVNPRLHKAVIPINRYGVRQIRIGQNQQNPPIARMVLDFEPNSNTSSVDWEAVYIPNRGAVIVRPLGITSSPPLNTLITPPKPQLRAGSDIIAIIQKISLSSSGQLLIQTDQPFTYLGTEDVSTGNFNITVNNARISPQLIRPNLDGTQLEGIRMSQIGSSLIIGLRPSAGWRIREEASSNPQQLFVQLYQPQNTAAAIPSYLDPNLPITDPPPKNLNLPPRIAPPRPRFDPPSPVTNRGRGVIIVDPGHGGRDVGAVGNGIFESNVVLAISLKVGRILQEMGYTVVYTRTDNTEVELQPRVDLAQRVNANVFVSIHANSLEARLKSVNGVETYYAPGATLSGRLASYVHNQIINLTRANDRGVRSARFHVIRRTSMPSILVETGFVTNPQESANLNNPDYQERMALAIARGVDQFLKSR